MDIIAILAYSAIQEKFKSDNEHLKGFIEEQAFLEF